MKGQNRTTKHIGFFLTLASVVSVFAGCKKNDPQNNPDTPGETPTQEVTEEMLAKAIRASTPTVDVEIGEYEHLDHYTVKDVDEKVASYNSSSILEMDKDEVINVVYNSQSKSSIQASPMLLTNLVNANNELHTITITDRAGHYIEREYNFLSATNDKISISNPSAFEYGEVYQITLNDADFLCFENRDPAVRTLTIEIEDDPLDVAEAHDVDRKSSIYTIDLNKVSNKKVNEEDGTYSFEYDGDFPSDIKKGDVFYATVEGKDNNKVDFYGVYLSRQVGGNERLVITYRAPEMDEIYNEFRLKGNEPLDLTDAEVLINDEVALQQFKTSDLARGIARATLPLVDNNLQTLTGILSNFRINVNANYVGNRFSMKFAAGIYNYKIKDQMFLTVDFSYEKITDYSIDFDFSIETKWIFPVGINYKVKCIEDTQEIFCLKATFTKALLPAAPDKTTDFTDDIVNEINAIQNDKNASIINNFAKDSTITPSTSGSKTSWPILVIDVYMFAPLSIRFRADFYIDAGFQAMMMFRQETHSKKVDFCFSNTSGSSTDAENTVAKSSNWMIAFAGNIHLEFGLRISLSISIFGLHDYIHAEAYAEFYIRGEAAGLLVADISVHDTGVDFSGYIGIDLSVTCGFRIGLDFKLLIFSYDINKVLALGYLLRLKYENSLEHWSDLAETEIDMNQFEMSLDETNVLWFNCFNSITMGFEETHFKADEQFSILSGSLMPDKVVKWTSGNMFEYEVIDPDNYAEISKDGVIKMKAGVPITHDFKIRIHVSNWVGTVSDREITVHFTDPTARAVYLAVSAYISGQDEPLYIYLGDYRPGDQVVLPEAPKFRGYIFDSFGIYELTNPDLYLTSNTLLGENTLGKDYHEGETFVMPEGGEGDLIFICFYQVAREYTVNFHDGNYNIVYVDKVYEGEDATAPYAALRDRFMDTSKYVFIGWNIRFNNVQSNLDVYAIYIGIGEVK